MLDKYLRKCVVRLNMYYKNGQSIFVFSRPFRDFNIENRAYKFITKSKPAAAPQHTSNKLEYERILKGNPDAFLQAQKKNEALYDNLKGVFVTSKDPVVQPPPTSSSVDRPLPTDRKPVPQYELGFQEPESVPPGKVTLRTALKFIAQHQVKPAEYKIDDIAQEHKLPVKTVESVMKYFRTLEVYVPEKKVKTTFAGPLVPRKTIVSHKPKQLPEGDEKG